MSNKAWVTLVTNDTYALGALVLAHSLKKVNTAHKLVVLVSSNVTFAMRGTLQTMYDEVKEVNILDSADTENLRLLARPELGITFTKLHCWKLTQYEKCVFLDADTLVLQNCDELFEREELSAAPDVGWPDCFNSGVFVFKPSEATFKALYDFAITHGSFDGGDQGLLNMYFSDWATSDASKRLPFLYNLSSAAIYSYLPAFKWYGRGVKIVHFIGNSKPWLQPFNSVTRSVEAAPGSSHLQNFLQYWWDLFCACVHPQLSPEMAGLANSLSQMKLDEPTPEQKAREDFIRKQNWEYGNVDYLGKDSFNNIWEKISQTMNFEPEAPSGTEKAAPAAQPVAAPPSSVPPTVPESSSVPEVCPKPTPPVQPAEQPASCPKPPTSAQPAEQPVSCPRPPARSQSTEQPPSCPKPASAEPAQQPLVCPKPTQPAPTTPAAVTAPVAESPVAPTPSKPAVEPVSAPPASVPVSPPVVAAPTAQVPAAAAEKVAASVPQTSPVCQKPAPPQAESQAKSSQEVKSAPAQDPSKDATAAPEKPASSKKK